jgi:hypothetical protein
MSTIIPIIITMRHIMAVSRRSMLPFHDNPWNWHRYRSWNARGERRHHYLHDAWRQSRKSGQGIIRGIRTALCRGGNDRREKEAHRERENQKTTKKKASVLHGETS